MLYRAPAFYLLLASHGGISSCSEELIIYASGLSQPEKLMDSLSNKYIDITQLEMLVPGYRASVIIIFAILQNFPLLLGYTKMFLNSKNIPPL